MVASLAPPNTAVYSATKAAVNAVTRSLAQELGPRIIRVNAINPGMIETEGTHSAGITDSRPKSKRRWAALVNRQTLHRRWCF